RTQLRQCVPAMPYVHLRLAASPIHVFFSSRRRHTRSVSAFLLNRSSDLVYLARTRKVNANNSAALTGRSTPLIMFSVNSAPSMRSEERRVGKECRCLQSPSCLTENSGKRKRDGEGLHQTRTA